MAFALSVNDRELYLSLGSDDADRRAVRRCATRSKGDARDSGDRGLLTCSNVFMTFAWYAHLRICAASPGTSRPSSAGRSRSSSTCCRCPANRIGYTALSLPQLKILQEVITLGGVRAVRGVLHAPAVQARLPVGRAVPARRGLFHVPLLTRGALRPVGVSSAPHVPRSLRARPGGEARHTRAVARCSVRRARSSPTSCGRSFSRSASSRSASTRAIRPSTPLDFVSYPYSHSLAAVHRLGPGDGMDQRPPPSPRDRGRRRARRQPLAARLHHAST